MNPIAETYWASVDDMLRCCFKPTCIREGRVQEIGVFLNKTIPLVNCP
jgi:hypothetical protein